MTLNQLNYNILRGVHVADEQALEVLVKTLEEGVSFNETALHNNHEYIHFLSEDLSKIAVYISTIGKAKALSDSILDRKLSTADSDWRMKDLAGYKLSSKSSTTHQINLRGKKDVHPFALVNKLLSNLYHDLNTKAKLLQSVSANVKFEIEKNITDYTIKRKIQ